LKHGRFLDRIVISPRLDDQDFDARHGQHIGRLTTPGARADDNHIIRRLGFAAGEDGHASDNIGLTLRVNLDSSRRAIEVATADAIERI